jgi:phage minor structural protein
MLRQPIKVGLNMQEYQNTVANEDLATALIPLGARLDTEVVPGLETKVDIKSVNGGLNYIVDDEAVAQYGLIFDVVEYDDVTKPANLKKLAERELANRRKLMDEYTISAVDLSLVDSDFDQFEIGMGVFVDDPTDPQHNVPDFMITGMNINPLDPSGNSITLLKSNWGYS